jgi:hypothetical protein
MKTGYIRVYIASVLLVSAILALWGCDKSMELQNITQCVVATEGGADLSTMPSGLRAIPDRQCYGLQWAIPLAYEPYVFGTPVENLNITMGLLTPHTPGAHMTEARKARELPQISVYPQIGNEFQDKVNALRKAAEETYGLASTGTLMYGMEVLLSEVTRAGRVLMFYPVSQGSPMVVCSIGAGLGLEQPVQQLVEQIDPLTLCTVTTYMDERLYAEYRIVYSLMPQFDLINSVLVNKILAFRIR